MKKDRIKVSAFFRKYGRILLGGFVLALIVVIAIFAPFLATHDPTLTNMHETKQKPGLAHLMGTDGYGRDIFSCVIYGTRISLLVGIGTAALSTLCGILLGLLAGYYKRIDTVIMRILDGISAFPEMLLAMTLAAVMGSGTDKVIIAIAAVATPSVARIVRAQVLSIKENEFIESAKATGASNFRIIFKYILPLCASPLIIRFTASMANAILTEASLSFLGVGIPPIIPSWGGVLNAAKKYVVAYPFMAIYPGIAIVITVLSISILGDGLRDVLDPKVR